MTQENKSSRKSYNFSGQVSPPPDLCVQPPDHQAAPGWLQARLPQIGLLIVFSLVYLGSMFSPALLDDADSTHAEAAREILVRGDYVTLHVNGVRYLEKAPLLYWLVAFSYRIFGVNEFAARLPTALAVLLLAALGRRWGTRAFGQRAGTYAALLVLTSAGVYLFTRILVPEALLSLLIASSFYFFLTALFDRRPWRWYCGYACVALAVLTKGLVALVFAGLPAVAYLLVTGEWRRWRQFHLLSGLTLLLAIAAPWHLLAAMRNSRFLWFYFINEHLLRFLGKRYPADYNKLPATLYWLLHLAWLFPWSFYLPMAAADLRRDGLQLVSRSRELDARNFASHSRLLCWLWAGVVLLFFSVSTNQEYYTFPAYFPLLLLLAAALSSREEQESGARWLTISTAAMTVIAVAAGLVLIAGLWYSRHLPYVSELGDVLSQHNLEKDTLSMSHVLDLNVGALAALRLPAALAALALILGPLLSLGFRVRRKHYSATWTLACAMTLLLVAAHVALVRFEHQLSSKSLAGSLAQQAAPADRVMIYGDQAFGSSLLFYLQRPIELVNGRTTSMWFGSTYPDAPPIFLNQSQLLEEWRGSGRIFLFVPAHQRSQVDLLLPWKFVMSESSNKVIYTNRPWAGSVTNGATPASRAMMPPGRSR